MLLLGVQNDDGVVTALDGETAAVLEQRFDQSYAGAVRAWAARLTGQA